MEQLEVYEQNQEFKDYLGPDRVEYIQDIQDKIAMTSEPFVYSSGLPTLDKYIDGFQTGEVVVLSGPTGEGKTVLCQTLISNLSRTGCPCVFFSYEVGYRDVIKRFGGELPVFTAPLTMEKANKNLSQTDWLEQRIREAKVKYGVKAVFIDHLHFLIEMRDLSEAKSISLAVGDIMRKIKLLSIRTDTIIFLVCHITKISLDKAPSKADLRDSSFIGQEADMVILVWRRSDTDANNMRVYTNETRLLVDKNRRTGRLGGVNLFFSNGRFYE
jgi:replicative DNA helicase